MLSTAYFLKLLAERPGTRADRAVAILAYMKRCHGKEALTPKEIGELFYQAHLARPSVTVLRSILSGDRRVSFRGGLARSLHRGDQAFLEIFPECASETDDTTRLSEEQLTIIRSVPYIDEGYLSDLQKMLDLYSAVHVLENSMRRLIEDVLTQAFGSEWWERCASAPQKQKHTDRLTKEASRKWLPARSSLGPLYSLDWSDLIALMRKHETLFVPKLGEINFLHRFADMGLLRHVIAHSGFVDDPSELQRVRIALRDWQRQLTSS